MEVNSRPAERSDLTPPSSKNMDLLSAAGWRQVNGVDTIFRRPLGQTELGFHWDAVFNGVAITINRLELEAEEGLEEELFARENVERAWVRLKLRFPLLGATVEELPGTEQVEFILNERHLRSVRPGEINYLTELNTAEDVSRFADELLNGPSVLDNEFLAKLWIGPQKDAPRRYHAYIPVVHHITDGMGNATVQREFCQELSSLLKTSTIGASPLSNSRLEKLLPVEALGPGARLSVTRRRWRIAIAQVIRELRQAKLSGGHTLPTRGTLPPGTPVLSRTVTLRLSPEQSQKILRGCRARGITLGNALPVLSQLAIARVLHRLHHRGELSDEEWDHRRVQPMHFTGPINFRPYLDKEWYQAGGASEVCIAISFYTLVLPYMPTSPVRDATGAPPLSSLLSPERFVLRARLARVQGQRLLADPLLHELHVLRLPERNRRTRASALAWRAKQPGQKPPQDADIPPGMYKNLGTCVFTNGGASLGDRDHLLPVGYPYTSPKESTAPARLRLLRTNSDLRCRPGELYLGAVTSRGHLSVFSCVDANTYDMNIVMEWMEEVREAVLFYLGRDDAERVESVQARL